MNNGKVYWILINGFFAVSMYFGFFQGVEAAESLAIFIAWICIVTSLFFASESVQEVIKEKGRSMPRVYNISFDVFATAMLLYGGWWITAFCYMLHTYLQEDAFEKAEEQ